MTRQGKHSYAHVADSERGSQRRTPTEARPEARPSPQETVKLALEGGASRSEA